MEFSEYVSGQPSAAERTSASQASLNVAWMICVALGCLAIYILPQQSPWRFGLPLLIMVVYLAIGSLWLRNRNLFRFADSLYFMGFLWTIWSFFTSTLGATAQGGVPIASVFGYAVLTTGVGMFLRVAVIHGEIDTEETRADATARLQAATENFVDVLDNGTAQVKVALDRAGQSLTEFDSTTLATASDLQSEVARHVETASKALAFALKSSAENFGKSLENTSNSMKQLEDDVRSSNKGIGSELEELRKTLQSFSKATAKTTKTTAVHWESASVTLTNAATGLGGAAAKLQGIGSSADSLNAKVTSLTAAIVELEGSLGSLRSASAVAASEVTAHASADIATIEEAMGHIKSASDNVGIGLREVLKEIMRLLEPLK